MGAAILLAVVIGVLGLGTLFITPWVGGPLILIAVLVGVAGVLMGGAAAATDSLPEPDRDAVEAPHMPGPTGHETRVD